MHRARRCASRQFDSAMPLISGFSSRAAPTSVLTYHHDDEEDTASVPAADPTHAPAVNLIPNCHGLSQPQELGLNLHVPRPDTSMELREYSLTRLSKEMSRMS